MKLERFVDNSKGNLQYEVNKFINSNKIEIKHIFHDIKKDVRWHSNIPYYEEYLAISIYYETKE